MSWWGKIIGGGLGFAMLGPLGAIIGAGVGHWFDKGMSQDFSSLGMGSGDQEAIQTAFFTATFSVMGHIAKADGRVSENEIATAEAVMQQLGLDADARALAVNLFQQGKDPAFDLDSAMEQFKRDCGRRHSLVQMFLEIQLMAASADGVVGHAEKGILYQVANHVGVGQWQMDQLIRMVMAQQAFHSRQQSASSGSHQPSIAQAYDVLGIESRATDAEVKRAYRKLMAQHHPDKLVAKGLPEEMIKVATEKTQEIKAAYEMIKKQRGS